MFNSQSLRALGLFALLCTLGFTGCTDETVSIVLQGNFPKTMDQAEEDEIVDFNTALYPDSTDGARIFLDGFIDLEQLKTLGQPPYTPGANGGQISASPRNVFRFGSFLTNQLVDNKSAGGLDTLRVNTNDVQVSGAKITYTFNSSSLTFERPFSALIAPDGEFAASIALVNSASEVERLAACIEDEIRVFQIPKAQAPDIIVPVFVDIQVSGETLDGTNVQSNVYTYPMELCLDCSEALGLATGRTTPHIVFNAE